MIRLERITFNENEAATTMFDITVLTCIVFPVLSLVLHIFVIYILRRLITQIGETNQKHNTCVVEKDKEEKGNSQNQTFSLDDETVSCSSNYLRPKNVDKHIVVFSDNNGYCTVTKTLNTTVGVKDEKQKGNSQKQTLFFVEEAVPCSSNNVRPENLVDRVDVRGDGVAGIAGDAGEVGGKLLRECEREMPIERLNLSVEPEGSTNALSEKHTHAVMSNVKRKRKNTRCQHRSHFKAATLPPEKKFDSASETLSHGSVRERTLSQKKIGLRDDVRKNVKHNKEKKVLHKYDIECQEVHKTCNKNDLEINTMCPTCNILTHIRGLLESNDETKFHQLPAEQSEQFESDYDYIDADPVEKGQESRTKTAHTTYRPKNEHTYRIEVHCRVVTKRGIAVVVFRLLKHPFTIPGAFCSGTIEIKLSYLGPLKNVVIEHYFRLQLQIDLKGHVNLCLASKFEEADTIRVFPNTIQANWNQSLQPVHIESVKHGQRECYKHQRKYPGVHDVSLEKKEKLPEGNIFETECYAAEYDSKGNLLLNNCHHEKDMTEAYACSDIRLCPGDQLLVNNSNNMIVQGFQRNYSLNSTRFDRLSLNSRPDNLAVTSEELHKGQETTQKSNVSSVKHTQGGSIQRGKANSICVDLRNEIDIGYGSLESLTEDVTNTESDIEVDIIPDTREQLEETKNLQILRPEDLQCKSGLYYDVLFPVWCLTNQSSKTDSSTCKIVLMTISFCDIDCQSEKQIGIHVLTDKSSLEETTIQFGEQNTLILDQSDSDDGYNSMDSESNSRMFDASDVSNKNSYRSIGSITSERNEELKNYASSMYDASDVSYNDSDRSIGSISSEWNEDYENYSSSLYGASGVSNNGSYRSIGSISSERNEEIKNYDSSMYGASDHSNNHSYSSMYSMSSARTEDFDYSNISMYGTSDLRNNNYLNIENAISDVEFHIDDSDCPNGNSKNTSVGIKCKMNSTATDDKEWYKPMERKKECLTVTVSPTQESAEGESDHHIRIKEIRQLVLSIGEQYIIIYDVKEGLRTIKKKGLQTLKGNRILIEGCSLKLLIQGKYDIKAVQVGNVNRVQIIT